eukprot:1140807_1
MSDFEDDDWGDFGDFGGGDQPTNATQSPPSQDVPQTTSPVINDDADDSDWGDFDAQFTTQPATNPVSNTNDTPPSSNPSNQNVDDDTLNAEEVDPTPPVQRHDVQDIAEPEPGAEAELEQKTPINDTKQTASNDDDNPHDLHIDKEDHTTMETAQNHEEEPIPHTKQNENANDDQEEEDDDWGFEDDQNETQTEIKKEDPSTQIKDEKDVMETNDDNGTPDEDEDEWGFDDAEHDTIDKDQTDNNTSDEPHKAAAEAERQRIEDERLEQERLEQERIEQERLEKEKIERERLEALEQERIAREEEEERVRKEKERIEQERLEKERIEREKEEERVRKEKERIAAERLQKEKEEAEKQRLENEAQLKREQEELERKQKEAEEEALRQKEKEETKPNVSLSVMTASAAEDRLNTLVAEATESSPLPFVQPKDVASLELEDMIEFDADHPWKQLKWSETNHGPHFKIESKTQIIHQKSNKTQTIALAQIFDYNDLNRVIFEVYPEHRTAGNIFGLLEYPLKYACEDADHVDVKLEDALWSGAIHESPHFSGRYFAIGTHESKFMNQLFRVWTPSRKVENDEDNMFELDGCEVQEGDKFVVELDLKNQFANVYVNDRVDEYRICEPGNEYTFDTLPDRFIFVYGCANGTKSNETVHVDLLELKPNKRKKKRKKKKPKKDKKKKKKKHREPMEQDAVQEEVKEAEHAPIEVPEAITQETPDVQPMIDEKEDDLDDDFDAMLNHDPDAQPMYTHFNTIPLSTMQKYEDDNPWKSVAFHRQHHGNKFSFVHKNDDTFIEAKMNGKNQHILLSQIFDCNVLNKCVIEFVIRNHSENSVIGLLEYPLQCGFNEASDDTDDEGEEDKEHDIKSVGLYGNLPLEQSRFHQSYYGVGTKQYRNEEKSKEFRIWTPGNNSSLSSTHGLDFEFEDGDRLLMALDLENRECDVYVNQISDDYLIRRPDEDHTFYDIPKQLVVLYGSHVMDFSDMDEDEVINVRIKVRLVELETKETRRKKVKRRKKKKPRRKSNAMLRKSREEILKHVTLSPEDSVPLPVDEEEMASVDLKMDETQETPIYNAEEGSDDTPNAEEEEPERPRKAMVAADDITDAINDNTNGNEEEQQDKIGQLKLNIAQEDDTQDSADTSGNENDTPRTRKRRKKKKKHKKKHKKRKKRRDSHRSDTESDADDIETGKKKKRKKHKKHRKKKKKRRKKKHKDDGELSAGASSDSEYSKEFATPRSPEEIAQDLDKVMEAAAAEEKEYELQEVVEEAQNDVEQKEVITNPTQEDVIEDDTQQDKAEVIATDEVMETQMETETVTEIETEDIKMVANETSDYGDEEEYKGSGDSEVSGPPTPVKKKSEGFRNLIFDLSEEDEDDGKRADEVQDESEEDSDDEYFKERARQRAAAKANKTSKMGRVK